MAFKADISKIERSYLKFADAAFALCFLSTGQGSTAFDLIRIALSDMTCSKKRSALANSTDEGFLRVFHLACTEFYEDNPRKRSRREQKQKQRARKTEGESAGSGSPVGALPFSLSDPLRRILKLSPKYKTVLYLTLVLGWDSERAARVIRGSKKQAEILVKVALEKTRLTKDVAKKVLLTVNSGGGAERIWDRFLVDREEKGFEGKQRLRRFKRLIDTAMPYLACGALALGVIAFCGVEFGWFTGAPYSRTEPLEDYEPSDSYLDTSSEPQKIDTPTADVSVFVPQDDGYTEYVVRNTPLDISDISRQMVYLGALPEGASALSSTFLDGEGEKTDIGSAVRLEVELSPEAAEYIETAQNADAMLRAIAQTYLKACGSLEEISIRSAGGQLTANGMTAQDFIDEEISPSRTVETDFR